MAAWLGESRRAGAEERWWRVSGNSNLNGKGLAIVRELVALASGRVRTPRQTARTLLRDDMDYRTGPASIGRREAGAGPARGMEWGKLQRCLPEIIEVHPAGIGCAGARCPAAAPRETSRKMEHARTVPLGGPGQPVPAGGIGRQLVGTPSDVRDLILHRTINTMSEPPQLARGWRADVVGRLFEDLLDGKVTIRIADPNVAPPASDRTHRTNLRVRQRGRSMPCL